MTFDPCVGEETLICTGPGGDGAQNVCPALGPAGEGQSTGSSGRYEKFPCTVGVHSPSIPDELIGPAGSMHSIASSVEQISTDQEETGPAVPSMYSPRGEIDLPHLGHVPRRQVRVRVVAPEEVVEDGQTVRDGPAREEAVVRVRVGSAKAPNIRFEPQGIPQGGRPGGERLVQRLTGGDAIVVGGVRVVGGARDGDRTRWVPRTRTGTRSGCRCSVRSSRGRPCLRTTASFRSPGSPGNQSSRSRHPRGPPRPCRGRGCSPDAGRGSGPASGSQRTRPGRCSGCSVREAPMLRFDPVGHVRLAHGRPGAEAE